MASIIVNQGLQRIGINASNATAFDAARFIRTMSVDDSVTALAAGTTNLGTPTNFFDVALDATPTRSAQTISHVMTVPTGSGNFTIKRVVLHDDTAANVTGTSTTVVAGVDGQSLLKSSDFSLTITLKLTFTSV